MQYNIEARGKKSYFVEFSQKVSFEFENAVKGIDGVTFVMLYSNHYQMNVDTTSFVESDKFMVDFGELVKHYFNVTELPLDKQLQQAIENEEWRLAAQIKSMIDNQQPQPITN